MQLGDLAVIAAEKRQQIAGKIALVIRCKGTNDAEIDGNVLRVRGVADIHENIARVHVGVEETVPKNLGEEDLHPFLCQYFQIDAGFTKRRNVGNGDAVDALHDQNGLACVVPVDGGDINQR